ncbi:MAG: YggS family pyridoxal phosphate-dependent enzyme [Polyangiales bacterium]
MMAPPADSVLEDVGARVAEVRARMATACARAGRAFEGVELVAVSKKQPLDRIVAAHAAGLRTFAENYAQELVARVDALAHLDGVRWRFIGNLQRNKVNAVLETGATIDTLDRLELAEAIARRAEHAPVDVLVQVNVGRESQKSGVMPEGAEALVDAVRRLPGLRLRGLLAVPPASDDPEASRPYFRAVADLARSLELAELSMGMSADLEVAIEEGATMVRVGTDLFGERTPTF